MLLAVTFIFLVLLVRQCVVQCFWMLEYGKIIGQYVTRKWKLVDTSFTFAKLGVVINSSIKWFLYCFTSTMFHKEMRKSEMRKWSRHLSHSSSSSSHRSKQHFDQLLHLQTLQVDEDAKPFNQ